MAKEKFKTKKRILMAKISFLSLCPRGANHIQTIYKSEEGAEEDVSLSTVIKGDMSEQGEILACVYAPDMADCDGDVASAKVIKEFAYDFAVNGKGIDIRHNEDVLPKEDVYVAESFIIQKDDPRFKDTKDYDGNSINVTGGWGVVLKVDNEELRKQYRNGDWGGISMGGLALKKSDEAGLIKTLINAIKDITGNNNDNHKKVEKSMKDSEKKEFAEEITKSVLASLEKSNKEKIEKIEKEEKEAKEKISEESQKGMGYTAPMLKENPSDEDIANYAKNMDIFELSKAVDRSDCDSIRRFQVLKKAIIDGKEVHIDKANGKNQPFDAFSASNQDDSEVTSVNKSKDPIAEKILENIRKAKEVK